LGTKPGASTPNDKLLNTAERVKSSGVTETGPSISFQELLASQANNSHQSDKKKDFALILEKYDLLSQTFVREPNIENLKKFRATLQEILKRILDEGVFIKKYSSIVSSSQFSSKREYTVIKINHELEKISRLVLAPNNKAINLMSNIEEIRGLIINLLS
jgi:uncharacterized protein YaaR (DUF327 family)